MSRRVASRASLRGAAYVRLALAGRRRQGSALARRDLDELGGLDPGYRLYCEDIDLAYRAARAGWERWLVPAAVVEHAYAAEIDRTFLSRRTLWHLRGMLRFVCKHPERLLAL